VYSFYGSEGTTFLYENAISTHSDMCKYIYKLYIKHFLYPALLRCVEWKVIKSWESRMNLSLMYNQTLHDSNDYHARVVFDQKCYFLGVNDKELRDIYLNKS
jgi:hypothetical protein